MFKSCSYIMIITFSELRPCLGARGAHLLHIRVRKFHRHRHRQNRHYSGDAVIIMAVEKESNS